MPAQSAEVLEAKALAEAALHYAKVTAAANDTHADCLQIITRAEMRMADEVDRGQAEGTVATLGSNQHSEGVQGADTLGLDRRRVAEWRETRDAGEEVVEQAINGAETGVGLPPARGLPAFIRTRRQPGARGGCTGLSIALGLLTP